MRRQWCREHIDEVAEKCDLSKSVVYEVKQAAEFCNENSEFSECPTHVITTLIREKNDQIREKAISSIRSFLNLETPQGGRINEKITAKQAREFLEKADIEIRKEYTAAHPELANQAAETKPDPINEKPKEVLVVEAEPVKEVPLVEEVQAVRPEPRLIDQLGTFSRSNPDDRANGIHYIKSSDVKTREVKPVIKPGYERVEVILTRSYKAGLEQMVNREMYADLEAAAQASFEKGWDILMDRIDGEMAREYAEVDEEAFA